MVHRAKVVTSLVSKKLILKPIALSTRLALVGFALGGATMAMPAFAQTAAATDAARSDTTLPVVNVAADADAPAALPKAYAGGQVARGGRLGILGNTDVMDTPFSTVNYTADLLQNQQSRTLADVVINDLSVRVLTAAGGFGDDFLVRGFSLSSGDVGFNGLYGLTSASRLAAEVVERVEVQKGPSALLNGMSPGNSVGGGINVVTKRATDTPLTRLTTTYRSGSQFGVHADVGRRFGKNNEWGVRFNGVYRDGETNLKDQKQKVAVGGLGLDYNGGHVRWSLDALVQNEDIDGGVRPQVSFAATSPIPQVPDSSRNFIPGTNLRLEDRTVATRLEIDLNDRVTAYGALGQRRGYADQFFVAARNAVFNGNYSFQYGYFDSYSETLAAEVGLRARLDTGPVKHNFVVSTSRLEQEAGSASGTTTITGNIYNPVAPPPLAGARFNPTKTSDLTLESIALADSMSMLDDRLLVTVGVRHQRVDFVPTTITATQKSYAASANTPMAAVVFKLTNRVSLYGNYIEGLSRGAVAPDTATNRGEVFPPFKTKQKEVGIKFDSGALITSLGVFEMARPSSATDPATGIFSFGGEQRNRGIELTTFGTVARGVRLMAGAAFTDSEITRVVGSATNLGNTPAGVPKKAYSFGGEWDLPGLAGLTLNTRGIYTGSVYSNANNLYKFPSWTRYDLGARYVTRAGGKPVTIRGNIENVLDKEYWVNSGGFASVGAPRTFVLSASVDF